MRGSGGLADGFGQTPTTQGPRCFRCLLPGHMAAEYTPKEDLSDNNYLKTVKVVFRPVIAMTRLIADD